MTVQSAPRFEMETVRAGYVELCRYLRDNGDKVEPRGLACREVTGATMVVRNPVDFAMPIGVGRGLNQAIGAVEALQLLGGVSHPALMVKIAPNFKRFLDGGAFHGAYGPRVNGQLVEVQRQLKADPDTRQAVVAIWDKGQDLWTSTVDLPCTLSLQFLLRKDGLELHTTMRSNDVWWGWTYDAFQFTRLQLSMARAMGVAVGPYVHRAGSLHLYERDFDAVDGLSEPVNRPWHAPDLAVESNDIRDFQAAARGILAGEPSPWDVRGWYGKTLEAYT